LAIKKEDEWIVNMVGAGLALLFLVKLRGYIESPSNYGGLGVFKLDAICLCVAALCLSAWSAAKTQKACWGLSAFSLIFVFMPPTWITAALKLCGITRAAFNARMELPSLVLVVLSLLLLWETGKKLTTKSKHKRGVDIRPLKVQKGEQQIIVGKFDADILPPDVRDLVKGGPGDKISLPVANLTRGISILGDPGSGKSRLMWRLLDETQRHFPDIPVLIHDPKGEWLRTYYDSKHDLIFAPYDKRATGWDIFSDIKEHPQLISSIAATAVSQHHGAGAGENLYWVDAATSIVKEQLETSGDLMSFRDGLLKWREDRIRDKTALSAYSSARPAVRDIATIALSGGAGTGREEIRPAGTCGTSDTAGKKLLMSQFLNHRGRIFLLNSPMQAEEQNGAFAIFLSAFMLSCLSEPDTSQPRACVIIDEALTFHLPPKIEEAICGQSRSKGLITIAAAQWLPKDDRRLITRADFRFGMKVGDLHAAQTLAALCGQAVYEEQVESTTSASGPDATHTGKQERSRLVMPPEYFRSLQPRAFVLLQPGSIAPGYTGDVAGEQRDNIPAFEYQQQPQISDYMKVL
jgi:hypothetical protein